MSSKIMKKLRMEAHNMWETGNPNLKKKYTKKQIYDALKREYKSRNH